MRNIRDGGTGVSSGDNKRQLEELSSQQIAELKTQINNQNQSNNEEDLFESSKDEEETNKKNASLVPYVRQNLATQKRILKKR